MPIKCSTETFVAACREYQSCAEVCRVTGLSERGVYYRRNRIHAQTGEFLKLDGKMDEKLQMETPKCVGRVDIGLQTGVVIVASDAHYWPGIDSTAHRALVFMMRKLKPQIMVMNGDAFDGARVSKHPRIGWDNEPGVKEQLEVTGDKLHEIISASHNTKYFYNYGNHDLRYNTILAAKADQFEGVKGFALEHFFPRWKFQMSLAINNNTMIKHRFSGGVHAVYNNVLRGGWNIVTGHLHSLKSTPWTDYNGTRYGVDSGTLAYPFGDQFKYAEDNPRNHRSGFVVLTFMDGFLRPPELVEVIDEDEGICFFRGHDFNV